MDELVIEITSTEVVRKIKPVYSDEVEIERLRNNRESDRWGFILFIVIGILATVLLGFAGYMGSRPPM